MFENLSESIKGIEGARMEDNKFCVSVHYRNVAPHVSLHLRVPFSFLSETFLYRSSVGHLSSLYLSFRGTTKKFICV